MKWDKHIQYIINKTKYLIYVFAIIKKYMDTKSLTVMYYAFFHSYINYDKITCGGVYKDNMTRLQNIQTRILKIIQKLFHRKHAVKYKTSIYFGGPNVPLRRFERNIQKK